MLTGLISFWGIAEPILFFLQFASGLRFKYHSKVTEGQYESLAGEAFREVKSHLVYFKADNAITGSEEMYLRHLKNELKRSGEFYLFLEGEIHLKLLRKFRLPEKNRINHFLINSFFFIHGLNKIFKFLLFKERVRKLFKRKFSFLHYLSINGWRNLSATELAENVISIKSIKPLWNDRYLIPKNIDFAKEKPTISRAIDSVLAKGKISEKSIFNLATSEKLIFVHKYGEGFSDVYNQQIEERNKLKLQIEKFEKSKAQNASRKLKTEKEKLTLLNDEWLKAPIGVSLENYGFQKLFSKMDGVYVLPLSLLPEKYQNNIDSFLEEVIIDKAKRYVEDSINKGNSFLKEENKELKYLIYSHVVPVHEIKVLTEKRNVEISSPTLSRMLFTSYLANENSKVSSLYINDIVRNVDFQTLLKENKTDSYIKLNFETLKLILWTKYSIDILKPFGLSKLLDNHIEDIIDDLIRVDSEIQKHMLRKKLKDMVDFYKKLNDEINEIKK